MQTQFDYLGERGERIVQLPMKDLLVLFMRAVEYQEMPKSDKMAVAQNFLCLIEKKLGVYPHIE